jgi:hypothetical protein
LALDGLRAAMIVSRIEGGLGNQMFQYAYGAYLAHRHQCEHWLDISSYAAGPAHGYLLDRFQIEAPVASSEMLSRRPRRYRVPVRATFSSQANLVQQLCAILSAGRWRRHKESPFGFHPRHLKTGTGRYLVGYWQSEKFFPGMRAELLRQFSLRSELSDESRRVAERMEAGNSLSIHVRRGDYVSNAAAAKIYYPLGTAYYLRAIEAWGRTQATLGGKPQVFVFSNDMNWCRQHFQLDWPVHFVDHNTPATAHEDLILMSLAKSSVIANSTFSWWAAWLNRCPEATIYAPSKWFLPGTLNGSSIVPATWCRLDLSAVGQPV